MKNGCPCQQFARDLTPYRALLCASYTLTIPISTWFYQLTGKIYLEALVNALLVAWMVVSSQVIAPVPV